MKEDKISRSDRRTVLKSLVAASATGFAGVSSAAEQSSSDDPDRSSEVRRIVVDDTVKRVTRHDHLFVGDKDQTLAYIDRAELSTAERKRARNFLQKMWRKYPVRRVETEDV